MNNLFLELSYRGTHYSGSQIQKNSITIQDLLNKAIKKIFNQKIVKTIFSGRTDAGVHAVGQVVNVQVERKISEANVKKALNSFLPVDIKVKVVKYVSLDFNARYCAKSRSYIYNLYFGDNLPLNIQEFVWHIQNKNIDIRLLKKAVELIKGEKDFSTFCAAKSEVNSKIRKVTISRINVEKISSWLGSKKRAGLLITYKIEANGFLYHMVRNIIAALVDVATGKMSLSGFKQKIEQKDRTKLKSITAPSAGLALYKVNY